MTRILSSLLALLTGISSSYAESPCGSLLIKPTQVDSQLTRRQVREMISAVEQTTKILGQTFLIPDTVELTLLYEGSYGADPEEGALLASLHLEEAPPRSIHHARVAIAHEVGHLITFANFRAAGHPVTLRVQQLEHERRALEAHVHRIQPEWPDARLLIKQANRDFDKILRELETIRRGPFGAFDELMADIVATAYAGDGQSVAKVVPQIVIEGFYRDFTLRHRGLTASERSSIYSQLNVARRHIWHHHLRRHRSGTHHQAQVLKGIFNAIHSLSSEVYLAGGRPDFDELNRELIARVDAELRSY